MTLQSQLPAEQTPVLIRHGVGKDQQAPGRRGSCNTAFTESTFIKCTFIKCTFIRGTSVKCESVKATLKIQQQRQPAPMTQIAGKISALAMPFEQPLPGMAADRPASQSNSRRIHTCQAYREQHKAQRGGQQTKIAGRITPQGCESRCPTRPGDEVPQVSGSIEVYPQLVGHSK